MYSAVVGTNGTNPVQVFPDGDKSEVFHGYLFINIVAGSGDFDFSFDGGKSWHLRPYISCAKFKEDRTMSEGVTAPAVYIRRAGPAEVTNLIVELWDGILRTQ